MERNDNLGNLGDASGAGLGGTTGGASGAGGTAGGTGSYGGAGGISGGSSTGGYGGTTGSDAGGAAAMADRAKDVAGNAQERLSDVGSTVRERAGQAKNSLADALAAGAERLRGRGGQQLAGSAGYSEASVTTDGGRIGELGERVAGGLQTSADWLREADIDGLRQGVERQVRENPGRTLMIAVGLGYLLGKAFRR
jgi:hypothetical protein